ncbi:MAG: SLC13 family permease [Polyangiaceae bacterium]|nr:SLC13 family permease [Myxococcales bacterium]MCB9585286.1 SLC13 family permease [Polyangiaceae bacterium]MCB9606697.1 SLC13 family permease [Polyangiaceae bacterium]
MTQDVLIVFATLAGTIVLFVSDRLRLDVVALLSLLVLVLSGVVSPAEGVQGFSNPIVLMIAGLFVVGGALSATGVADWLGGKLSLLAGTNEARLLVVVMLATALLSAFMSSTGTVAVLLPVVGTLAQRAQVSPSRLLMPMAFASLLGGLLTLIGTPPNIVVADQLRQQGLEPFRFFSFTPAGVILLGVGVAFMALVGRRLLPGGGQPSEHDQAPQSVVMRDIVREYGLEQQLHRLRVPPGAPCTGSTLAQLQLRTRFEITVVGIARTVGPDVLAIPVVPTATLRAGDVLLVQSDAQAAKRAASELGLDSFREVTELELPGDESVAEVVIPRRSHLVGRTLRQLRFGDRYRATVLAVRGVGKAPKKAGDGFATHDLRLESGDTLLITGRIKHLKHLVRERRDFVMVTEPRQPEDVKIEGARAFAALLITLGMLVLMAFGILPNVIAVILAAVCMVLFRCLDANAAYRGINWESVVLIAAILPMATALEKTGAMRLIVDGLVSGLGGHSPYVLLVVLFLLTSAFSQVVSNTATTVLVAPIAYKVASDLGLSPHTFLMTIAIAASTAFATPIASPVNTLVLNPGGYRFRDYLRVGVSLQLVLLLVSLLIVPWLFPFY